jgi:NAD(P)-dependent dehydrogenase (short-subunit alcohol dehydrogenase family)
MSTELTPQAPDRVVVVTGANQGLGRALVARLLRSLPPTTTIYLTGRDSRGVAVAAHELGGNGHRPVPHRLDVRSSEETQAFATLLADRHGGIDVVISNAAARITPTRPMLAQVRNFVDTNNFGATRMIRAFGPLLRPGGRFLVVSSDFGTLSNLPAHLHERFGAESLTLDELDGVMARYVDAVESGVAAREGWPAHINIPSKIGQTAAMRVLARDQRELAARDGRLISAVCPGLIATDASRPWFADMSAAQSPAAAAVDVVSLVVEPPDPGFYGELVQHRRIVPWRASYPRAHE